MKQAATHDETSLCIWLSSHKLPVLYDDGILSIPTEKLPRVVKPDNKYCIECGKKLQEVKYTSRGTLILAQYPYLIKG